MKVQHTVSWLPTYRGLLYIYVYIMDVEEVNFSHNLIVALRQTNISHVQARRAREQKRPGLAP